MRIMAADCKGGEFRKGLGVVRRFICRSIDIPEVFGVGSEMSLSRSMGSPELRTFSADSGGCGLAALQLDRDDV